MVRVVQKRSPHVFAPVLTGDNRTALLPLAPRTPDHTADVPIGRTWPPTPRAARTLYLGWHLLHPLAPLSGRKRDRQRGVQGADACVRRLKGGGTHAEVI